MKIHDAKPLVDLTAEEWKSMRFELITSPGGIQYWYRDDIDIAFPQAGIAAGKIIWHSTELVATKGQLVHLMLAAGSCLTCYGVGRVDCCEELECPNCKGFFSADCPNCSQAAPPPTVKESKVVKAQHIVLASLCPDFHVEMSVDEIIKVVGAEYRKKRPHTGCWLEIEIHTDYIAWRLTESPNREWQEAPFSEFHDVVVKASIQALREVKGR